MWNYKMFGFIFKEHATIFLPGSHNCGYSDLLCNIALIISVNSLKIWETWLKTMYISARSMRLPILKFI